MKRCAWTRKRLVSYLDGELGGRSRSRVKRHLDKCSDCLRDYRREKSMEELLRAEFGRTDPSSGAPLAWKKLRPILEKEATAAEKVGRLKELKETLVPKAGQALAESLYWGKMAALPAAGVLIAFVFYSALRGPEHAPAGSPTQEATPSRMVMRINFGTDDSTTAAGYYTDAGKTYKSGAHQQGNLKYGWKQG